MYSDLPKAIRSKEHVWAESFENFAELLPFNGEQSDALFEFELSSMCADPRHFLQVSIGRLF